LPQDIPYALEIPRIALNKAVGPEEVARLALMVARSELDGVHYPENVHVERAPVALTA